MNFAVRHTTFLDAVKSMLLCGRYFIGKDPLGKCFPAYDGKATEQDNESFEAMIKHSNGDCLP